MQEPERQDNIKSGAEVNPEGTRNKCGDEDRTRGNVEIEFKKFKISELLDIKIQSRQQKGEE